MEVAIMPANAIYTKSVALSGSNNVAGVRSFEALREYLK
jgi:hypothetical protein